MLGVLVADAVLAALDLHFLHAVAALSGAIHQFDELLDGHHALLIEQGVEMGRPSKIHLHLEVDGGKIAQGRIGGNAVKVAEGVLLID